MRLIDADTLKEYCMCASKSDDDFRRVSLATLASVIDVQPTTYDMDKVVAQLEDYGNEEMYYYKNTLDLSDNIFLIRKYGVNNSFIDFINYSYVFNIENI